MKKLIVALILVTACSKGEQSVARVDAQHDARGAYAVMPQQKAAGYTAPGAKTAPAEPRMPRMIVRTAEMRILVADTTKTVEAVTKSVEASGGYVSGSNIWREGELLRAKLTLRVPSDKLTATLASIRGLAKRVENETVTSEDVSQEYVDLSSQLRNLQATEAELRELLKTARVNSKRATDVLEVHTHLTGIRGQIEQIEGRMRYLSQVSAMSSINLDVVPDAIAQPVVEPGWRPMVEAKNASRALVALMQNLATGVIWFVIYLLPILGMLGLAIAALVRVARRSRTA